MGERGRIFIRNEWASGGYDGSQKSGWGCSCGRSGTGQFNYPEDCPHCGGAKHGAPRQTANASNTGYDNTTDPSSEPAEKPK